MADELPPLPAERMTVFKGALKGDWYTEDQMRAYAQEAARQERDRCAKLCEDYADRHAKDDDNSKAQAWMMLQCAAEIRSPSPAAQGQRENGG